MSQAGERLTAVELCAGVGGMSLGFEQAGFDVLAAADLDPVHLAAHERSFPLCEPVCADLTCLDGASLMRAARRGWLRRRPSVPFAGPVDCVFGGPSCQGFSIIGSRNPQDPRNDLVSHFARLVIELRPRWFVMENVPGLVSPAYASVLDGFRRTLRTGGYSVAEPWLLNARNHGVPQERKRVFIVGSRIGEPPPELPSSQLSAPTVREALHDLAPLSRFKTLQRADALALGDGQLAALLSRQSQYVRALNGRDRSEHDLSDPRSWDAHRLTSVGMVVHSESVVHRFLELRYGERDRVSRLPKLDPDGQSPTLRAGTGRDHGSHTSARPVHYASPRVISVREAARLHGFPDWFGFHATKWHGFRQVGNAVPPPLARAVAETVVRASGKTPARSTRSVRLGDGELLTMTMLQAAQMYGLGAELLPPNVRVQNATREAA